MASWFGLHPWLPYVSVAAGSYFAIRSAYESIKARELDVNLLMVAAAIGAIALGHPAEAAVLLFLFSLSSTLEALALGRTKSAIADLVRLRPETAILVGPHGDVVTPVIQLKPGDRIRVLPFEQIPTDGRVLEGQSQVNQAAMTGESVPVSVAESSRVLAGTQNLEGMIVIEVTAAVGDTALDRIVELVRDAQENQASGERISAWFGKRYTIFVVLAFAASLLIRRLVGQDWSHAAYASLTFLVALSPCAIVISSPAASLSALAWAARNGILVRGGQHIETAGRVRAMAVDKTGTLTTGQPELAEICVCSAEHELAAVGAEACREADACWHHGGDMVAETQSLLRLAAAGEQYSTHPIAEAIVRAARERGLDIPEAQRQTAFSGLGVEAVVDGHEIRIGQRRFFEQGANRLPAGFAHHAEEIQRQGMTVAILQSGTRFAALGLRDSPRPEARAVISELNAEGIEPILMITGDTKETAAAVADEVGITSVHAGLLPADKERIISDLAATKPVMMVGDGINDAPSLARADLGVAMGGLGSDIALNSADIVLMHDRLECLPEIIRLGRKTNSIIRANLIFAGLVIAGLTVGSVVFDIAMPAQRNLVLPFAVVGHEGSTVLVILNGLRLLSGPRRSPIRARA